MPSVARRLYFLECRFRKQSAGRPRPALRLSKEDEYLSAPGITHRKHLAVRNDIIMSRWQARSGSRLSKYLAAW